MKKLVSLLVVCALALSVFGCGQKSGSGDTAGAQKVFRSNAERQDARDTARGIVEE